MVGPSEPDDRDPLVRLVDEVRAEDSSRERSRERWLRQQSQEGARFVGMLRDLAERGVAVSIGSAGGRTHQGRLVAVGRDYCALRGVSGRITYLALHAVAVVRPESGMRHGSASGDRDAPRDRTLNEVCVRLAGERPRLCLYVDGLGQALTGELRAVGEDVLTLRLDGDARGVCYVQAATVTEMMVVDR